jgi:hypothetical protein
VTAKPLTAQAGLLEPIAEPRRPAPPWRIRSAAQRGGEDPRPHHRRPRQRKRAVRGKSICVKRLTKVEIELGKRLFPDLPVDRPQTRGDGHRRDLERWAGGVFVEGQGSDLHDGYVNNNKCLHPFRGLWLSRSVGRANATFDRFSMSTCSRSKRGSTWVLKNPDVVVARKGLAQQRRELAHGRWLLSQHGVSRARAVHALAE